MFADEYVRANCGSSIGEHVTIGRVDLEPAAVVGVAQVEGAQFVLRESAAGIIERLLVGSSAAVGDLLGRTADVGELYVDSPKGCHSRPLCVVDTVPEGPVLINEATVVRATRRSAR